MIFFHEIFEGLKIFVLVRENDVFTPADAFQRPGHGDVGVIPENAVVVFSVELFGTLVADYGFLKHQIAVGAPCGNEHLAAIFAGKVKSLPLFEGRAVFAKIHGYVPHMPPNTAHKLGLLDDALEMQGADHALVAGGVEDLCQVVSNAVSFKNLFGIVLGEAAAHVVRIEGRNLDEAVDGGRMKLKALYHISLRPDQASCFRIFFHHS